MALTKVEAAKLSNDMLMRGVIQTIVKESPVLNLLPFMQVIGTAFTYNRETTMPATGWYAPGDTWAEATPTFTQINGALTILGGDADVDNFLQTTYSDTNDLTAEVIASRAKAIAHQFSDAFFNGDIGVNSKSFDGIHTLIPVGQTITAGANGAALTVGMIDQLIDKVAGAPPDALLMSKRTRRQLKELRRLDGISRETRLSEYGQQIETYDGIPILVDDFIKDDRGQGSSGNTTSTIYAVSFGLNGILGAENNGIQIESLGSLETKDATRTRLKWYASLAMFNQLGCAKLIGLLP